MHANLFRQRGKDKKFCAARGPGTFIKVRRGWLAQNLGVEFLNFTQPLLWDSGVVKIGFLAKNFPISPIFIFFDRFLKIVIFENRDLSKTCSKLRF